MSEEELLSLNMKSVILDRWKSKLGYPFNLKDLEELENIIDYYEGENQSLKKQLEELDKKLFFTKNELEMRQKYIDNKLNQQKEFIEYLENMLDNENDIFSVVRVKDVLSKYQEIIGSDINVGSIGGKDENI